MTATATPPVRLRAATEADRDALLAIYASTRAAELELLPWSDAQKAAFVAQQFAAQHGHYHDNYVNARWDLVLVSGEVAGRLYVDRWRDEIRVVDIALLPRFRGRGIGERLLRGVLDEAQADGLAVTMHVERSNPARRLYDRLGFEVVDDLGVYVRLRWTPPSIS